MKAGEDIKAGTLVTIRPDGEVYNFDHKKKPYWWYWFVRFSLVKPDPLPIGIAVSNTPKGELADINGSGWTDKIHGNF